MKTIQAGDLSPQAESPIWTGVKINCPNCKGSFELEAHDVPAAQGRRIDGRIWFRCPTADCISSIEMPRPIVKRDGDPPEEKRCLLPTSDIMQNHTPEQIDGFPRRNNLEYQTPVEAAIREAMEKVESAGAHPLLTDAITLLGAALDKVADWTESRTLTFDEAMREADAHGLVTDEMQEEWMHQEADKL